MDKMAAIEEFFLAVHHSLEEIGYNPNVIRRSYPFADVLLDQEPERRIDMAIFGQEPTSYRSACFGITITQSMAPEFIKPYKALGAPHIFSYVPTEDKVGLWIPVMQGEPKLIENFPSKSLPQVILDRKDQWNPAEMLRSKSIGFVHGPRQLDMFDIGLLPAIEEIVHSKLDELLRNIIASAKELYSELNDKPLDYRSVYRLIFRLMAAKLLADRQQSGSWNSPDVQTVINAVESFYFTNSRPEPIVTDRLVQQLCWDKMRQGFHFQNLSVEAIAYVYENTFVDSQTRKALDIHATPPSIAEYIVRQLPFETLDVENCRIFEPFAGHAPFLVAAIGRLRPLLRLDVSSKVRHEYFTRIVSGMELDPFAREAAFNTLRLADFPNPNGWKIYEGDIFASKEIESYLRRIDVILCNPPYSKFTSEERREYTAVDSTNKAVEALNIVLRNKPKMLGFVLPRIFLKGRGYHNIRKQIANFYNDISVVCLPDIAFHHSGFETVLLIAHGKRSSASRWSTSFVSPDDYRKFTLTGKPSWQIDTPIKFTRDLKDPMLWVSPLLKILEDSTSQLPRLSEFVEIHRGIEYLDNINNHVSHIPLPEYKPGLHKVDRSLSLYEVENIVHLDTNSSTMRGNAYKYPWHLPKVLANAARRSRGPWTIEAAIDESGLVCYQDWHGIWPKGDLPIEVIAAVINGPVANAYINLTRISAPHNQKRQIEQIPVPRFTPMTINAVVSLVREYLTYRELMRNEPEQTAKYNELSYNTLVRIDSEIWSAYKLPEQLAEEILLFFKHHKRPSINKELQIDIQKGIDQLQVRSEIPAIVDRLLKEKADLWADLSKY